MSKLSNDFWDKWYKTDELKRLDLIKKLHIHGLGIDEHADTSLINSYLCNLAEYLQNKFSKTKRG